MARIKALDESVVDDHLHPAYNLSSTTDCEETTMRFVSFVLLAFAGFASAQYYLTPCAYECAITSCKGEKADCVCGHGSTDIDTCISAVCAAGLEQAEARESVKKFCRR
ncbi:hypothetical protein EV121DRAFT_296123 [Schizophyllum commune]